MQQPSSCGHQHRSSAIRSKLLDRTCHRSPVHSVRGHSAAFCRRLARSRLRATTESTSSSETVTISLADIQPVQCLKEWAPACAALGHGQQTILLRKGGIREPTFKPKAQRFLLFPTSFHTEGQLLKPGIAEQYQQEMQMEPKQMAQIPLQYFAEITGAWTTKDDRVLRKLDPLHVYAEGFLETRLKWRSKEPLTLLELRCYMLEQPLLVPAREQYFGCFSWVELVQEDAVSSLGDAVQQARLSRQQSWQLHQALRDEEFAEKQRFLREQLKELEAQHLVL